MLTGTPLPATTQANSSMGGDLLQHSNTQTIPQPNKIEAENLAKERKNIEAKYNITPIKEFGTNYAEFYHDGANAIKKLLAEKQGQVAGAFERKELGDIDLVWGNEKIGLNKIVSKHLDDFSEFIGSDKFEKLSNGIDEIITNGKLVNDNSIKTIIYKNGNKLYRVGLSKGFNGVGDNSWIITAYKVDKVPGSDFLPSNQIAKSDGANLHSNTLSNTGIIPPKTKTTIKPQDEVVKTEVTTNKYLSGIKELEKIDYEALTQNQKDIYDVFAGKKPSTILKVSDIDDLATLEQGSRNAGARKIMIKHAGVEKTGGLNGDELVNIEQTLLKGKIDNNSFEMGDDFIRYSYAYNKNGTTLQVVINEFNNGKKIFDYYSNRNFIDYNKKPQISGNTLTKDGAINDIIPQNTKTTIKPQDEVVKTEAIGKENGSKGQLAQQNVKQKEAKPNLEEPNVLTKLMKTVEEIYTDDGDFKVKTLKVYGSEKNKDFSVYIDNKKVSIPEEQTTKFHDNGGRFAFVRDGEIVDNLSQEAKEALFDNNKISGMDKIQMGIALDKAKVSTLSDKIDALKKAGYSDDNIYEYLLKKDSELIDGIASIKANTKFNSILDSVKGSSSQIQKLRAILDKNIMNTDTLSNIKKPQLLNEVYNLLNGKRLNNELLDKASLIKWNFKGFEHKYALKHNDFFTFTHNMLNLIKSTKGDANQKSTLRKIITAKIKDLDSDEAKNSVIKKISYELYDKELSPELLQKVAKAKYPQN
ncbi:hypothetical protein CDQ80_05045 [Campylobacter hyointestinalis subsp. hyointestinalis]|nr:hypothetical protein CDQ79_01550 [Campylobacter hyointestinalis subsp. hyointestinalis]PPB75014.1 hypothetical protein CDQ80_05045 [Campylobacter hyointestinalis subsp. hyointestinalis]PPB77687.1 hypothetical protein CDQ81_03345 [Campylobacter hyointestinalis subsp. hyointestinalis]